MAMNDGGVNDLERILGKRIQSFRRSAGLTQQQLCNQANISYSTLTKIERGAIKSPSIFTVEAIANSIGVSLDQIVGSKTDTGERQLTKTSSGISFIYFDVNGCLVGSYQRAFTNIAEKFGISTDLIEATFWHYNDQVCKGTISLSDFNDILAKKIGTSSINYQDYYLEAIDSVKETDDLIKWAFKHFKVGLLTNIMPGLLASLRRVNKIPNLEFDAVVDSSEVGHIKPEAEIYKLAEVKAQAQPKEILLIDDTRANIIAAEKAGWHVAWFDYANPVESVERIRKILEASS